MRGIGCKWRVKNVEGVPATSRAGEFRTRFFSLTLTAEVPDRNSRFVLLSAITYSPPLLLARESLALNRGFQCLPPSSGKGTHEEYPGILLVSL